MIYEGLWWLVVMELVYKNDYAGFLYNGTSVDIDFIRNIRLQYASATGSFLPSNQNILSGTIFYLEILCAK